MSLNFIEKSCKCRSREGLTPTFGSEYDAFVLTLRNLNYIEYYTDYEEIEIENLLYETLSYDEDDLRGNENFKKNDYMGSYSNLLGQLEELAIKKGLLEEKLILNRVVWWSEGPALIENKNTNFSRIEISRIYQQISIFAARGIIASGAPNKYGYNYHFHVTDYGTECLNRKEIMPYNKKEYLSQLEGINNLNEWVEFYTHQALECFNTHCFEASAIMIGLASECIVEELIENFMKYLRIYPNSGAEDFEDKIKKMPSIAGRYEEYLKKIKDLIKKEENRKLISLSKKLDKSARDVYLNFIRLNRNELSHPNKIKMERINILMLFIPFPKFCELQYEFINYFRNESI